MLLYIEPTVKVRNDGFTLKAA